MSGRRGHNEGTIYERPNGSFQAQITFPNGRRRTFTAKSKTEVRRLLKQAQIDLSQGRLANGPCQTLKRYLLNWLELKRETVRVRTAESYALNVERLLPRLGHLQLDGVRPADIQGCYQELTKAGLAPRSILQAHRVLHAALKHAVRLELLGRNPTEVVIPPRPSPIEYRTLTASEVVSLLKATRDDELHALWIVLVTTGLRLGEAAGLPGKMST